MSLFKNVIQDTKNWVKNIGQYDRPRVLGCKPVDGVQVVLSSNQLNIAMFVHQMGHTYPIILAQVLYTKHL